MVVAGRLDHHTEFEHAVADRRGLLRRGFERLRVADHLDAQVQPDAVHGADDRVLVLQRLQSRLQVCARRARRCCCSPSSRSTSRTVMPIAHDSGLPPVDEKK